MEEKKIKIIIRLEKKRIGLSTAMSRGFIAGIQSIVDIIKDLSPATGELLTAMEEYLAEFE